MTVKAVEIPSFASTVTAAVDVLDHVWSQVHAMKASLGEALRPALQSAGFTVTAEDGLEDDEVSRTEDITIAWLWGYKLRKKSGQKGGQKHLGRVYVLVRIAPRPGEEDLTPFTPYVSIHVDHKECGVTEIAKFEPLLEYRKAKQFKEELFPSATLCRADYLDDGDEPSAAAFVPLEAINHANFQQDFVLPAARLVKHCCSKWFPDDDSR